MTRFEAQIKAASIVSHLISFRMSHQAVGRCCPSMQRLAFLQVGLGPGHDPLQPCTNAKVRERILGGEGKATRGSREDEGVASPDDRSCRHVVHVEGPCRVAAIARRPMASYRIDSIVFAREIRVARYATEIHNVFLYFSQPTFCKTRSCRRILRTAVQSASVCGLMRHGGLRGVPLPEECGSSRRFWM